MRRAYRPPCAVRDERGGGEKGMPNPCELKAKILAIAIVQSVRVKKLRGLQPLGF